MMRSHTRRVTEERNYKSPSLLVIYILTYSSYTIISAPKDGSTTKRAILYETDSLCTSNTFPLISLARRAQHGGAIYASTTGEEA